MKDLYFKVVRPDYGHSGPLLRSFWSDRLFRQGFSLEYFPQTKTIAPDGMPIFIFNTLRDALNICSNICSPWFKYEIWACTVENPRLQSDCAAFVKDIDVFWRGEYCVRFAAPEGTYVADAITLVEKVVLPWEGGFDYDSFKEKYGK